MNEKIFLLLLGCVIGLVTSLPIAPSTQAPPTGIIEYDNHLPVREGDMLINVGRSSSNCSPCLWPKNANGTVSIPYILSSSYTSSDIKTINDAMDEFAELTCVRFVPRMGENDYLNITSTGCASFVGKIGGRQIVYLGGACVNRGSVQHELNHALGHIHEHSRSDRDSYVNIMWQYISPANQGNFVKDNANNLSLPYDYGSVMHYSGDAFSNTSNQPTIVPKPNPTVLIGQRYGLSVMDVTKINQLYQCSVDTILLNNQKGNLTSANYPASYPNNSNSVWLIRAPTGQPSLTFSDFDLQSTPNCTSDYLRIYDGPNKNSIVLLDKMCGKQSIPQLIAYSGHMLVEFVSDGAVAGNGFNATYSSVQCGGTFFNFERNFTSPGYPNSYSPNMDCTYTITAPVGYQIYLTISDFLLEYGRRCMYDNLKVFIDGQLWGTYCSNVIDYEFISNGNSIVLVFHSDSSKEERGFQASYYFF